MPTIVFKSASPVWFKIVDDITVGRPIKAEIDPLPNTIPSPNPRLVLLIKVAEAVESQTKLELVIITFPPPSVSTSKDAKEVDELFIV